MRFPPRPPLAAPLDRDGKRILTKLGPSKLGIGPDPISHLKLRLHDVEFRCSLWPFHQPTLPVAINRSRTLAYLASRSASNTISES